jgi:hypothetical protein
MLKIDTSNMIMSKDNTIFRTMELKKIIVETMDEPFKRLAFYIKDNNLKGFIRTFDKSRNLMETKDEYGNTLLNLAVQANSNDITCFLIDAGAKVNTQDVNFLNLV